jgi:hypothetical protein
MWSSGWVKHCWGVEGICGFQESEGWHFIGAIRRGLGRWPISTMVWCRRFFAIVALDIDGHILPQFQLETATAYNTTGIDPPDGFLSPLPTSCSSPPQRHLLIYHPGMRQINPYTPTSCSYITGCLDKTGSCVLTNPTGPSFAPLGAR